MNTIKTIRAIAAFDFLTTVAFVLPWTAGLYVAFIYQLHGTFVENLRPGFDGDTLTLAFVNTTGVLAVLWAIVRWQNPTLFYSRLDAFGRLAIAALLLNHIAGSLSPIFLIFVATEITGAILQLSLRAPASVSESPDSLA
jgi:hypothetical protein